MATTFAIAISILALSVSVFNLWLTWFHRGTIRMTVPSMVVFAYDRRGEPGRVDPKVMVRTLLFTTGAQGHAIETLFLRLRHDGSERVFPVWGLATDKLDAGGGLFVGKTGVTAWHHFVASEAARAFQFKPGHYELDICVRVDGRSRSAKLWTAAVSLPDTASMSCHDGSEQVWFDRNPESGDFQPRIASHNGPGV